MDAHQRRRSYAARYPISPYIRVYRLTEAGKAELERQRQIDSTYLLDDPRFLAGKKQEARDE